MTSCNAVTMSSAVATEVKELYRQFWRLYKRWPAEELRSKSFREEWMSRVRRDFVENKSAQPEEVSVLLAKGKKELEQLEMILDGGVEKEVRCQADRARVRSFRADRC